MRFQVKAFPSSSVAVRFSAEAKPILPVATRVTHSFGFVIGLKLPEW